MTTYTLIFLLFLCLALLAYILYESLRFKCPYWKHCANYEKGTYVCDKSDDEYRHSCYKYKKGGR